MTAPRTLLSQAHDRNEGNAPSLLSLIHPFFGDCRISMYQIEGRQIIAPRPSKSYINYILSTVMTIRKNIAITTFP